jgi:hypothetical protein
MENVDGFEVFVEDGVICIKFLDIFNDGEIYYFPVNDAKKLMLALSAAINAAP